MSFVEILCAILKGFNKILYPLVTSFFNFQLYVDIFSLNTWWYYDFVAANLIRDTALSEPH